MRGYAVRGLQRLLRRRVDRSIRVDGVFGPQTERAVRTFQRRHGIPAVGYVGPATARALGFRLPQRTSGTLERRSVRAPNEVLRRIAMCESGGNPRAISRDGRYRGKYQFDYATWRSVGGRGDPARASEREQDQRALILYRRRGTAPWPHCGKGL